MTTEQDAILRRYFTLKRNQDWIALQWRTPLPGFKTQRVAKVTSEGRLLFTIGETDKGQACDLNTAIAAIIQHHGLLIVREPTTSGNDPKYRVFLGFRLDRCSDEALSTIIDQVMRRIAACP